MIKVDETPNTKVEKTRRDRWKWTREFLAFDVPAVPIRYAEMFAYTAIRSFIANKYPVFTTQLIQSLEVTEIAPNTWRGVCQFLSPSVEQKLKLEYLPEYSFSTKGGTAHKTHSRKTVKEYAGYRPEFEEVEEDGIKKLIHKTDENGNKIYVKETIPKLNRGIGWNAESASFDGVDIQVSTWKSTVKMTVPNELIDVGYLRMLRWLTCSVNSVSFDGMNAGECLFVGVDGTRKAIEVAPPEDSENPNADIDFEWQLTFDFLGSPNATVWVDGIGYVEKRGWDYMHRLQRLVDYPVDEVPLLNKPMDVDPPITGEPPPPPDAIIDPDNPPPPPTPEEEPTAKEALKYTIAAPLAVYIEQVYPYADFSVLGFNLNH